MANHASQYKKVTVVGAGIVGLLSAYFLNKEGYRVFVYDKGPNPLRNYNKDLSGATYSGGNARHVSATETSPHASPSMKGQIFVSCNKGGWLGKDEKLLTDEERAWALQFELLTQNPTLFSKFTKTVVKVNNLGKDLWRRLRGQDPSLFESVNFQESITVFFLDEPTFKSETVVETKANPNYPIKALTSKDLASSYPASEDTIKRGVFVGGLVLDGFALHSISFCQNVIKSLENQGVTFSWDKKVTSLGEVKPSDYYVISTGASKQDFLLGSPSHNKIMGVAGVWIRIPNPGFKNPIKIACPYPTGYINGTLDGQELILSGGYGYIGQDTLDKESHGIKILFDDIKRNIKRVFPKEYAQSLKMGTLDERACVRPMKASGLGVFEVMNNVIFIGSNNAGGFTQAPVLANAVLDIIRGKSNFLLKLYSEDNLLV